MYIQLRVLKFSFLSLFFLNFPCRPIPKSLVIFYSSVTNALCTLKYLYLDIIVPKKKKSKAVPLHAMEALGGRESTAPIHS
jgi:hypothetical protein